MDRFKIEKMEQKNRREEIKHNRKLRKIELKQKRKKKKIIAFLRAINFETGKLFIGVYGIFCMWAVAYGLIMNKMENLLITIMGTTVLALLGYFASARFGKYHEEKNRIMEDQLNNMSTYEREESDL